MAPADSEQLSNRLRPVVGQRWLNGKALSWRTKQKGRPFGRPFVLNVEWRET
jgi:hypothetical protein